MIKDTITVVSPEQYRRINWHSRRGMLELDELLLPFVKEVFPSLNEKDQHVYMRFITNEDTDLFHWMIGHGRPELVEFQQIIEKIKTHALSRQRS